MSRLLQHSSKISAKTRAVWIKRTTAKLAASILGVLCGVCTGGVERVTRLATSNRLLRESEARMRQVLENMPVMMNAFDADGLVVVWNRECERVTGYRASEIVGNPRAMELLVPDAAYREGMLSEWAAKADHRDWEWRFTSKNGRPLIISWSNISTSFPVRGWATWGIGIDLTTAKQVDTYRIAVQKAETASRVKSEFLANMSHELRTPLNAILGFSEIMIAEMFGPLGGPKYSSYVRDIHASGQHLLDLVTDILDLSKIESGKDELQETMIDVPRLLQAIEPMVNARAETGRVELQTHVADGLPRLQADSRKLKQILVNLLSNAIKFTEPGGGVRLKAFCREDGGMTFQIEDTGVGIAAEDISTVFSPFGQVESSASERSHEGTGIGLPLTLALVEQHGGTLRLESEEGVGTTVSVEFPSVRTIRWREEAGRSSRSIQAAGL